jgi:hypothetical protein
VGEEQLIRQEWRWNRMLAYELVAGDILRATYPELVKESREA